MPRAILRHALGLLTWLAVVWTIYEEQHHLLLYVGDPEIAFGIGEYFDITATAALLAYAIYAIFRFVGATGAFDRYIASHPALDALILLLLLALGWGIYRDITHFRHLYLGPDAVWPLGENFDEIAAALLALGALKTGYHAIHALRALARLTRRR